MLITSDEEVLDSIIKNNGLNDVLIYILENYRIWKRGGLAN